MDFTFTFHVEEHRDDAGVSTFTARRKEDYDRMGVPSKKAIKGDGETPLSAIAALCETLEHIAEVGKA